MYQTSNQTNHEGIKEPVPGQEVNGQVNKQDKTPDHEQGTKELMSWTCLGVARCSYGGLGPWQLNSGLREMLGWPQRDLSIPVRGNSMGKGPVVGTRSETTTRGRRAGAAKWSKVGVVAWSLARDTGGRPLWLQAHLWFHSSEVRAARAFRARVYTLMSTLLYSRCGGQRGLGPADLPGTPGRARHWIFL